MKSGSLNFLETSGPLQACNGTSLALPYLYHHIVVLDKYIHSILVQHVIIQQNVPIQHKFYRAATDMWMQLSHKNIFYQN